MRDRKLSTVHVGSQPQNLSFSGCGFLGVYHIGVAACFKQHAPEFLRNVKGVYGCSAGSIVGAMLLSDVCCGELCRSTMDVVKNVRSRYLGPLSPGFSPYRILRDGFNRVLPPDAHHRCSGRLYVSLTRVSDMKNVIVSEFATREELIDALLCSSFVPFYSGFIPPSYRGVYYVDGGLTNNLPSDPDTITVSPWSGGSDICPKDNSAINLLDINIANTSVQMTVKNLQRLSRMLFPPDADALSEFCKQGFRETLKYLKDHGLFETINPSMRSMTFSYELEKVDKRRDQFRKLSTSSKWMAMQSHAELYLEELVWEEDETDSMKSDSDYLTMSCEDHSSSDDCDSSDEISTSRLGQNITTESDECVVKRPDHNPWKSYFEDNPILKYLPVATIVELPSTSEELDKILQSNLPYVVMKALEECQLDQNSRLTTNLGRIASVCGKPLSLTKISIEKSFSLALFLIKHASYVPENLKWLLHRMSTILSDIQEKLRSSGAEIIQKLLDAKNKVSEDAKLLFCQLYIVLYVLTQKMLSNMPSLKLPWISKLKTYSDGFAKFRTCIPV